MNVRAFTVVCTGCTAGQGLSVVDEMRSLLQHLRPAPNRMRHVGNRN
jgi:hypothetical protein